MMRTAIAPALKEAGWCEGFWMTGKDTAYEIEGADSSYGPGGFKIAYHDRSYEKQASNQPDPGTAAFIGMAGFIAAATDQPGGYQLNRICLKPGDLILCRDELFRVAVCRGPWQRGLPELRKEKG